MKIPYDQFPTISQEFIDEVFIRTKLALDALDFLPPYSANLSKKEEYNKLKLVRYITFRFAIVEFLALIDGSSKLSITLEKNVKENKIKVQKMKLKKLFPFLLNNKFNKLHKKIQSFFKKHQQITFDFLWNRHNRIAHANISWYEYEDKKLRRDRVRNLKVFIEEFQFLFEGISFEGEL